MLNSYTANKNSGPHSERRIAPQHRHTALTAATIIDNTVEKRTSNDEIPKHVSKVYTVRKKIS